MVNRSFVNGLAVVVVGVGVLAAQALGDAAAPRAHRTSNAHPDLSGIWQAASTAHWNLEEHESSPGPVLSLGAAFAVPAGDSVVEGGTIPYQDWAAAKRKENQANWLTRDPEIKCYMPGVPRATYMPYPLQIVQGTKDIVISYAFANAMRIIHTEREKIDVLNTQSLLWMGWSLGRWEGRTFVVDVHGFNDKTWFDRSGNFHSDQLLVQERYTLASRDVLQYEARIEDPKVFTRPWKLKLPLYRLSPDTRMHEYNCVPFTEELLYGRFYKNSGN